MRNEMPLSDASPTYMTASDRYLGLDEHGQLVSHIANVVGTSLPGTTVSFEIPPSAPAIVQALQPREQVFAILTPMMLYSSPRPSAFGRRMHPFPEAGRPCSKSWTGRSGRC